MSSVLACGFCTLINERGAKTCNACGRTLGLPTINLNPSGVECSRCTFQNPFGTVNCSMCQLQIQMIQSNGDILPKTDQSMTVDSPTTMAMDVGEMCQICLSIMTQDFKMPGCAHIFCTSCAKHHFTIKITECGINHIRCPIDTCTAFDETPNKLDFFSELKMIFRGVLDSKTRKVFQDKVEILEIMDKSGFIRCSLCNHGFINHCKTKKTTCPDCYKSFCSKCGNNWATGHTRTNCTPTDYGLVDDGNSDLQMYTNATCPQCKYKYFLERGGCMHLTCNQCSYEFCEFCFKKITGKGKSCDFPNCPKGQSLHGHHPRNCMYYLQEMDHSKVELLLKNHGVHYTVVQKHKTSTCKVKVNKTSDSTWVDSECQKPAAKSYNNMCLMHYKWHLGELLKKHSIDPVDIMNNLECMCELKRNNVKGLPNKSTLNLPIVDQETAGLRSLIRTHIPYEDILQ